MTIKDRLEIRTAKLGTLELRAAAAGKPNVIAGYAAVFNRLSQNLGGFVERVDPGAFSASLAKPDPVLCRYNHDDAYLLGTTEAETLRLTEDGTGLAYEADLPDTTTGRDVAELAGRGDLRYSSFAFYTLEDDWDITDQGFPMRILRSVQLVDVAPVNNPAYRDTTAGVRSLCQRIGVATIDTLPVHEIRRAIETGAGGAGGTADRSGRDTAGSDVHRDTVAASAAFQARRRALDLARFAVTPVG